MRVRRDRSVALAVALALLAAAAVAPPDEYEIGPGDTVRVVVLGQADMSGTFAVDSEGLINFPILGKIKASEHTTLELERKLTTLLADGYLKRPQVTVTVAEYGSQKVFVTGEVQRPGAYALKADRSLLALMSDIGPLGPNAGYEVIVVRPPAGSGTAGTGAAAAPPGAAPTEPAAASPPQDETSPPAPGTPTPTPAPTPIPGLPFAVPGAEVFHISLLELQSGNPEKNLALKAGDTVYFPKAAQVYVMGSVARPGPYRYEEGMTVLQVLTLAGGATERGASGRTKVIRIVGGKKVEKKVKPTDPVSPEDTLIVPERFF
jgi:polysaccharide export outer membrane protein